MKKFLLLFLLMIFLSAGCGNGTKAEKIIVGLDESPLGYFNEKGELVGFEVDLAKATAKNMGVAIEFKIINWDNKEEELNSGNIDMIWNGMDITLERKAIMLFSEPYMDNRRIILVLNGNPQRIFSKYDLKDKTIGAKAGTTSALYINYDENLKNIIRECKIYQSDKETFDALDKGEIDAVICDEIVGRYEINKNPGHFEIVEETIGSSSEYGIGFRMDDLELRNRVQKAFDKTVKDGTAKKISEKWFGADLIKRR